MYNARQGGGGGGWGGSKKFGEKKPWERRSSGPGGGHEQTMHPATCSSCNQPCEVPFRPNGRKPVFCSNCFKKEGGGESRDFHASAAPKTFSREPRAFSLDTPSFSEHKAPDQTNAQFAALSKKMDTMIQMLSELLAPEIVAEEDLEPIVMTEEVVVPKKKKAAKKAK